MKNDVATALRTSRQNCVILCPMRLNPAGTPAVSITLAVGNRISGNFDDKKNVKLRDLPVIVLEILESLSYRLS